MQAIRPIRIPDTGPETEHATSDALELSTGLDACDRLLEGGLAPGELVEIYGQRSTGRFSIALAALARTTSAGRTACLVDLGDGLDPQSAAAFGVDLRRLLWVRPRRLEQALTCTVALAAGGLPLVVVDLGIPPIPGGRGDEEAWRRLAGVVREHRATVLVSSPFRVAGDAASRAVEAYGPSVRWRARQDGRRILGGLASQLGSRSTAEDAGPEELMLSTSDALAEEAGDLRVLEFPVRAKDLPRYRAIA